MHVQSFTEDVNSDGIPDAVDLTLTVPKARTEQFVSVKLLTWFNMKLRVSVCALREQACAGADPVRR